MEDASFLQHLSRQNFSPQDLSPDFLWDLLGRSPQLRGLNIGDDDWDVLKQIGDSWQFSDVKTPPRVLLLTNEPGAFVRGLMLANRLAQRSPLWLFLGNPHWAIAEERQVIEQVQPHQIWSDRHNPWRNEVVCRNCDTVNGGEFLQDHRSYIGIGTGGSSGHIRFAMHTWESLGSAVDGFRNYFDDVLDRGRVHSFCTLPLFHVSGLMQLLRCVWSGGVFQWGQLPKPSTQTFPSLAWQTVDDFTPPGSPESPSSGFISLVPTQLARLLDHERAIAWLGQFRVILLGGAPPWTGLLERSRQMQLPIAPTYGMTETGAQVATLKPTDFLDGKTGVGKILPHLALEIADTGSIVVRGPSLAAGYWQGEVIAPALTTGDLGTCDDHGYLFILGRQDDVIITGGENVMPQEVEAAILATGVATDVCVVGVPDQEWGQRVAAAWVPGAQETIPTLPQWRELLNRHLSRYKHPKWWRKVDHIPRNSRGKVNRGAIAQFFLSQTQDGQ